MIITKESFEACYPELKPLLLEQYVESEENQGEYPLDPDYDTYVDLNEKDVVQVFVSRNDGRVIGYMIVMVVENIHHKGVRFALTDTLYVAPEYRRSMAAAELIRTAEEDLKQQGVKRLLISMKIKKQFRRLLSGLCFSPIEELWEKVL